MAEEDYRYNPETLFHKLRYAKWETWPQDERTAVKRYLNALWQCSLESFPLEERLPSFFEIETVLCSVAQTGESLGPYLETWTETKTRTANEHLIQFVTMFGADVANGRTFGEGFWSDAKAQGQELRTWLLRPETLRSIREEAYLLRNDGFEHLFIPSLRALETEAARLA
jgi:hypothetical protein